MSLVNVITAFTPTYREYAERLIQSGKNKGVEVTAYAFPHQDSWIAGTRIKAAAILRAMQELDGPILWIDADAEIVKPLDHTALGRFALHYDFCAPRVLTKRDRVFYVATMWFRNGPYDRQLVGRWKDYCKRAKPHHGDEFLLERARSDLANEEMPIAYGFMSYRWAWVPGCDVGPDRALIRHNLSGKAGEYVKGLSDEQKREVGL